MSKYLRVYLWNGTSAKRGKDDGQEYWLNPDSGMVICIEKSDIRLFHCSCIPDGPSFYCVAMSGATKTLEEITEIKKKADSPKLVNMEAHKKRRPRTRK